MWDRDGQQLAYVYFEDEPGRRLAALADCRESVKGAYGGNQNKHCALFARKICASNRPYGPLEAGPLFIASAASHLGTAIGSGGFIKQVRLRLRRAPDRPFQAPSPRPWPGPLTSQLVF